MKYIIHRGITSHNVKENSYLSIKKAIRDYSSCGVEFDIRLSKDKKIVLSHDSFINLKKIENINYLDIIKDEYLTTLDKVLSIDTDKIFLIDIKVSGNYKVFADTILKHLNDCHRNIYLCSFNKKIIRYLKKKSKYKVGCILLAYKRKNDYDFVMVNYRGISNNKIHKIRNKKIFLWTIKNEKELKDVHDKFSNVKDYYLIVDKEE